MFFTEFFFVWEQVIKILNIQTACELFTNIHVSKFNWTVSIGSRAFQVSRFATFILQMFAKDKKIVLKETKCEKLLL